MSNFIRDQQQNQKPDIQFQQHTQRRLPISIKMQTPGKATRRRSPRCTVNPLLNPLLPLQCPPTPGHRWQLHAQDPCPGQPAIPSATAQGPPAGLTPHFHVLWYLELRKEPQHCTRAALGWQGPAEPFPHPSPPSAPLAHPSLVRMAFGAWSVSTTTRSGVEGGTEGQRQELAQAGTEGQLGSPHTAERLQPWNPPSSGFSSLTHTTWVFLLLFIHGEIAHP